MASAGRGYRGFVIAAVGAPAAEQGLDGDARVGSDHSRSKRWASVRGARFVIACSSRRNRVREYGEVAQASERQRHRIAVIVVEADRKTSGAGAAVDGIKVRYKPGTHPKLRKHA